MNISIVNYSVSSMTINSRFVVYMMYQKEGNEDALWFKTILEIEFETFVEIQDVFMNIAPYTNREHLDADSVLAASKAKRLQIKESIPYENFL